MNKMQEDNVFVGMLVSIIFTATMFYVLYQIDHSFSTGGFYVNGKLFTGVQERFIATLAVFFNIIPFVIYIRTKRDNCLRGVGIVTILLAIFMLIYYYILHNNYLIK